MAFELPVPLAHPVLGSVLGKSTRWLCVPCGLSGTAARLSHSATADASGPKTVSSASVLEAT